MQDIKRLKGNRDLAQMNHASIQSEESKAAFDAAEKAYQDALLESEKPATTPKPEKAVSAPKKAQAKTFPATTSEPEKLADASNTAEAKATDETADASNEEETAEKKSE